MVVGVIRPGCRVLASVSRKNVGRLRRVRQITHIYCGDRSGVAPSNRSTGGLINFLIGGKRRTVLRRSRLSILFAYSQTVTGRLIQRHVTDFTRRDAQCYGCSGRGFNKRLDFVQPSCVPSNVTRRFSTQDRRCCG